MIYNSWNVIYRVKFDGENKNLQDDFDERDDAMEYAQENLAEKPIVIGTEVFIDEGGAIVEEGEPWIIFSYNQAQDDADVQAVPDTPSVPELDAAVAELDVDNPFNMDIPELSPKRGKTNSEILASNLARVIDNWEWEMHKPIPDPIATEAPIEDVPVEAAEIQEVTPASEPEADDKLFDPFDTDFTDVSADEEKQSELINNSMDPAEYLQDLAKQLGIADQVEIIPVEPAETSEVSVNGTGLFDIPEMPEAEPVELVDDEDVEYPDPVEEVEHDFTPSDIDMDVFDDEVEKDEPEAIDVLKDKLDIHGEGDTIVAAEKGQLDNPEAPKVEVEVTKDEFEVLADEFHEDPEVKDETEEKTKGEGGVLSKKYLKDLEAKGELKGAEEFEKEYKARAVKESPDDKDCHCEDGVCACDGDKTKELDEVFEGGKEDVIALIPCSWCGEKHSKDQLHEEVELGMVCERCSKAINPQSKQTKLIESQAQEISATYKWLSEFYGINLLDLVYGPEGFLKKVYPDGYGIPADIIFIEELWTEFEEWLKTTYGIDLEAIRKTKKSPDFPSDLDEVEVAESLTEVAGGVANGMTVEDIAEKHGISVADIEAQVKLGLVVEQEHTSDVEAARKIALDHLAEFPDYYDRLAKLEKDAKADQPVEEFYDHQDHTIPSTQVLKGTGNAVVPCKVADVAAHSEDEKPLDCKGEKPPLEKPLTEAEPPKVERDLDYERSWGPAPEDEEDEDDLTDQELAEKLEAARQERLTAKAK